MILPYVPRSYPNIDGGEGRFITEELRRISNTFDSITTGWVNNRSAKTGPYTVINNDGGSTLALGGSSFYTVTFGASSGYSADFLVVLVNEDTGRGKKITLDAVSFILWPGQSVIVFNSSGWKTLPAAQRWTLASSLQMYVHISAGDNGNDGLAAGAGNALATMQAAVNIVARFFDIGTSLVTINVVGSPTENVTITGPWVGSGNVWLKGDTTTPSNVTWTCSANNNVFANTQGRIFVGGFKFINSSGAALIAQNGGAITGLTNAEFGNCSGGHMFAEQSGTINVNAMTYTISDDGVSTDTPYHLLLSAFGEIFNYSNTVTLTGTPNFSAAFAYSSGGYAFAPSNVYSGAATGTRYVISQGGTIIVSTPPAAPDANYFPGNAAGSGGTTAGGGVYG